MVVARVVASLEEAEGHQHVAGGHRVGANKYLPFCRGGPGVATPGIFLYIFDTKSCILMQYHFYGSENGHYKCFYQDPYALGEMKTLGRGCRMRPEEPKIEAEGRERGGVLGEGTASPT